MYEMDGQENSREDRQMANIVLGIVSAIALLLIYGSKYHDRNAIAAYKQQCECEEVSK